MKGLQILNSFTRFSNRGFLLLRVVVKMKVQFSWVSTVPINKTYIYIMRTHTLTHALAQTHPHTYRKLLANMSFDTIRKDIQQV